jgi:hypothetical protein
MGRRVDPRASRLSRREFGRRVALVTGAAGAGFARADVLATVVGQHADGGHRDPLGQSAPVPELSAAGRARFETMWQTVLRSHGDRLSDDQKTRMRKIVTNNAAMLELVYAVPLKNGDAPAAALILVENKTAARRAAPASGSAAGAPPARRQPPRPKP